MSFFFNFSSNEHHYIYFHQFLYDQNMVSEIKLCVESPKTIGPLQQSFSRADSHSHHSQSA